MVDLNRKKCFDCRHCFRKNVLFELLTDEELDILNNSRTEVSFKKREIIFKQGSPLTHIVILNEGLGKNYIEGPRGKNLIISIVKPYGINGGPGMYVDMRHHSTLMALSDVKACFIDVNVYKEVVRKNAVFAEEFIKCFSENSLHTFNQFVTLTQKNMEGRIAEALLYLKNDVFKNGSISYISKQEIADLTGLTKESTIRVMKEFRNECVIDEENRDIIILNEEVLQKYADLG
jgi:CRP/FNR family transcriptional regulator